MLQLQSRSRATSAIVAMCFMALVAGVGCSTVVEGAAQSMVQIRVDRLHQKVEGADAPDAKYHAYWAEVCDSLREFEATAPPEAEWEGDPLSNRYVGAAVDYYWQLVDDGQLSEETMMKDGARFLAGGDTCDFMR